MESPRPKSKPHILYVDDEENNLISFKASFRRYYDIHTAISAADGIQTLKEFPIELVITDQRMPEMTGIEFLEKIVPIYPDMVRMILTGFSDMEDIIKAINTGQVYRYITKPWDDTELKINIDLALESYNLKKNNVELVENLRHTAEETQTILNNSTDVINILNAEGIITYSNLSSVELLGYSPEELEGNALIEHVVEDDRNKVKKEIIEEINKERHSIGRTAFGFLHKQGHIVFLESQTKVIENANGERQLYISSRDVSDKIRNMELQWEKEFAEDSARLKQQFLANMSHEIRTPMNAVIGLTRLVLQTELNPVQAKYVSAIKQSSENLLVIINDILDFSKIEAGKIEFEEINFNLAEVFEGVYDTIRFKAEEKGLLLVTQIDEKVPKFMVGDPVRLNQIILNLASNAVKFTEKGKVTVHCSLKSLDNNIADIEVSVTDTGIGIAEDKIAAVFESFSQASSDTTRKFGGTGLGLTISKQLVELQGGVIGIKSIFGEGTNFYFNIPFKVGEQVDSISLGASSAIDALKNISVLLVEDNQFNQMVAIDTLESAIEGIKIDVADNGKIAVDKILEGIAKGLPSGKKHPYDIVLMDCQMPIMDGYEATQTIRANKTTAMSGIPIMAMTANAIKSEVERCFASGMDEYISKPFEVDDLMQKIASTIKNKS